jgi:hypothetical protein
LTSTTLASGTYTITYNINGGSNLTTNVTFASGTGTFTTPALTAASSTVNVIGVSFVGSSCVTTVSSSPVRFNFQDWLDNVKWRWNDHQCKNIDANLYSSSR